MKGILVFVLLVTAAAGLSQEAFQLKLQRRMFKQYLLDHEKGYESSQEYEHRFSIFQKKLDHINQLNEKSPKAKFALNKFSDMTHEEFQSTILMPPIPGPTLSASCLAAGAMPSSHKLKRDNIPTHWDWRTKGVVSRVQDQGNCGSCWTFSATGNVEAQWALKGHDLIELSPQQLLDCSRGCTNITGDIVCNDGCNGGFQWNAFADIISWGGVQPGYQYPYVGISGNCSMDKKNLVAPITNYTCLSTPEKGANEDEMMAFLYSNGPLAVAMDADYLQDYSSGIVDPWFGWECDPTGLNHAILIVGFGEETSEIWGTTKYWIVKNSWGPMWGENGYFRIVRGKGACGIDLAVSSATL